MIDLDFDLGCIREEAIGEITIYPGMLLQFTNAGAVLKHGVAGGYAENLIAIQNVDEGGGIGTAYESQERVIMRIGRSGSRFLTMVSAGDIKANGPMCSDGFGWFKEGVVGTDFIIATCMEYDAAPVYPRWTIMRFN